MTEITTMKPIHKLRTTYEKGDKKRTNNAIKKFKKLGKIAHPFKRGFLRFHHRSVYFVYSPWSHKWAFQRHAGSRWNTAKGIEDMMEQINAWFDKKENK